MRIPRFDGEATELGTLFEDWWETTVCPIAAAKGWQVERTEKWSAQDQQGVDFLMIAPSGEVYKIDLCMQLNRKYGRYWKETSAVVSVDMVRKYLSEGCANLREFLDNATLVWKQLSTA